MLSRDSILAFDDLKKVEVPIPEWGGSVFVRMITGAERDGFEASLIDIKGKSKKANLANYRAKFASLVVCDEKGQRLFSDEDAEKLGKKCAAALDRIMDVAQKLNHISEEDVEELVKN
jgi:hypothetical protein